MNSAKNCVGIGALWMACALPVMAQEAPKGHWNGSVSIPNQSLDMEVDLDKAGNSWVGSISIPAQNISGIPLEAISFTDGKVTFHIKGPTGDPTFTGTLSADGKTLSGDFTQGPGTFAFRFTRTGDPKVEVPKPSPAVAKEFVGTWEGTLEAGRALRLVLKISNEANGAKALMISLDQGNAQIPVSTIEQQDSKLTLIVKMAGGGTRVLSTKMVRS